MGPNLNTIQRKTGKNHKNGLKREEFCGENKILRSRYKFCEPVKTIADPDRDGLQRVSIVLHGLYVHHHLDPELSYREKRETRTIISGPPGEATLRSAAPIGF
jgi:hypothetical protein